MAMFEQKMVVMKREDYVVEDPNGYLEEDKEEKEVMDCVGKKKGCDGGATGGEGSGSRMMRCCQAENCNADLRDAKQYHRKHKVCEYHAKAQVVLVGGIRQRFCQQCSRFHELAKFDETKRSCRRRLAGHNERRRKNYEPQAEGSSCKGTVPQSKDIACRQVDEKERIQIAIKQNAAYKHFHIR